MVAGLWQSFVDAHGACEEGADSESALALAAALTDIEDADAAFARFLGQRLDDGPVCAERIEALRVPDLWLAFSCARGDQAACARFTAEYQARIRAVVSRVLRDETSRQDVVQRVLSDLLSPRPDQPPKIAAYRGHAPLLSFVCVVAVNAARDAARRLDPLDRDAGDGELTALADNVGDPELAYLRELYRREYRLSFERAIAGLSSDERLLLKLDIIDRLTVRQAAVIYGRSPATTARHLNQARAAVATATIDDLGQRLGLDEAELDSIARLVRSSLELSVARLIAAE